MPSALSLQPTVYQLNTRSEYLLFSKGITQFFTILSLALFIRALSSFATITLHMPAVYVMCEGAFTSRNEEAHTAGTGVIFGLAEGVLANVERGRKALSSWRSLASAMVEHR